MSSGLPAMGRPAAGVALGLLLQQAAAIEWWQGAPLITPSCSSPSEYFDEATLRCVPCRTPASMEVRPDGLGCRCRQGYAGTDCGRDCVAEGLAADSRGSRCLPCANGSVSAATRDCTCAPAHVLADEAAGSSLPNRACVPCVGRITADGQCQSCESLNRRSGGGTACALSPCCACPAGTQLFGSGAAAECLAGDPNDIVYRSTQYAVFYPGVNSAQSSPRLRADAQLAYARCAAGWRGRGGCGWLANLCVAQGYDIDGADRGSVVRQTSGACYLYYIYLENYDGGTPAGCKASNGCEVPQDLPWLFYQRTLTNVMQRTVRYGVGLGDSLRVFVRRFRMSGEYIGSEPLLGHITLCHIRDGVAHAAWNLGTNVEVRCTVNTEWLEQAPEPEVYELFLEVPGHGNGSTVHADIPVRMAGRGDDGRVFFEQNSVFLQAESRLFRRFMLYENFLTDGYVRYAREVTFLAAIRDQASEELMVPMVTVLYEALERSEPNRGPVPSSPQPEAGDPQDPLGAVVLEQEVGVGVPRNLIQRSPNCAYRVLYVSDQDELHRTLLNLIITATCFPVLTAGIMIVAWSLRNGQSNSPMLLPRFFVYYCSHFGNYFLLIACSIALWFLLFFKFQSATSVMLPAVSGIHRLYTVLLWCSFATKFVHLLYHVWEQTRQWIFLVDWEVPRDQQSPVPLWRLAYVANELNALQGRRAGRPDFALVLTLFLLHGPAELQGLSSAQPDESDLSLQGSYSHPLLRIGVAVMCFCIATAICRTFDFLYFRFWEVEPLRQMAELCSVANVSVIFILEERWGYYLHGKSVHPFADASLREFQEMLRKEEEDRALPRRGLGGKSNCQCFELFINWSLHQELTQRRMQMESEGMKPPPEAMGMPMRQQHRRLADFFGGAPRCPAMSAALLTQLEELTELLRRLVQQEEFAVHPRSAGHRLVGMPDQNVRVADWQSFGQVASGTVLGPRDSVAESAAGQSSQAGGVGFASKITLYADAAHWPTAKGDPPFGGWQQGAPKACCLWGLEGPLWCFTLATYLAFDWRFQNAYGAAAAAFLCNNFIVLLRVREGTANLGRTSFLDERFFM
eukprot:TRINITY_DN60121_c0_g1_i1.p1 TRINITY_DN60121_c0_g1~~TRINITY_DN60121_c0_g1_i1.p1  ORF type:complete len:1081 (+),score=368.09 TRINITY_DN60121_c0_g1_i1:46-3288(+)